MQMEVRNLSLISQNHSSKSKMSRNSRYYESYTTSGPKRSVELSSYKIHTINPPSTPTAPTRRQSHRRATRTNKEGRSKYRSARAAEFQTEVSQKENQPLLPIGARLLSDGATWEYIYPDVNSTTLPATRNPKKDISDPHAYIGDPDPADVDYFNPLAVPVVDEEAVDSDESAEYDAQVEYLDASDTVQPPAAVNSPAVDWDIEQQPQHPRTRGHPSYDSDGFGNTYVYSKPKYTATRARHKRRESPTAPVPKPSFLESFLFPGAYREAMKQGKVRNDRVEEWLQAVTKEVAREIAQEVVQQTQQLSLDGGHDRAATVRGSSHYGQYQTEAIGYGYPHGGQY